jgi:hypothetical protein
MGFKITLASLATRHSSYLKSEPTGFHLEFLPCCQISQHTVAPTSKHTTEHTPHIHEPSIQLHWTETPSREANSRSARQPIPRDVWNPKFHCLVHKIPPLDPIHKVALGQVFSEYFSFPCQSSFHQLLHNHRLSSGAGTIGQQWPTYQVDSVSPHTEKLKKKRYRQCHVTSNKAPHS